LSFTSRVPAGNVSGREKPLLDPATMLIREEHERTGKTVENYGGQIIIKKKN